MPQEVIKDHQDIRINNPKEINAILGNPPGWLLRYGITLIFIIIGFLVFLSWVVKYPDSLKAPVVLTSRNPSIPIISKINGELDTIFYPERTKVFYDQRLGIMKTPLNIEELEELKSFIALFQNITDPRHYLKLGIPKDLELGELSVGYTVFIQTLEDLLFYLRQDFVFVKIASLQNEISQLNRLNLSLHEQELLFEKDLSLSRKNYERYLSLNVDKSVSDIEMEQVESSYLQQQRQLENFRTNQINNEVRIEQLRTEINTLKAERRQGLISRVFNVKQKIDQLEGEIVLWEEKHIIKAPISGLLSFHQVWSAKQSVQAGQTIFTIIPEESRGNRIAKCQLPVAGSGKVSPGNLVQIRLDAYPYQEFGVLTSRVDEISLIPVQLVEQAYFYNLEFSLPDTLRTNYQKVIPFQQNMMGVAIIVTEDRRILDRVFDKLYSILKN